MPRTIAECDQQIMEINAIAEAVLADRSRAYHEKRDHLNELRRRQQALFAAKRRLMAEVHA